jgi:hypothetical protein
MSLRKFLQQQQPDLFREYQLDLIRENTTSTVPSPTPTPEKTPMFGFGQRKIKLTLPTIASLPADHIASVYCRERMLPEAALSHLYFTDEWTTWIKDMKWEYSVPEDHAPRLVLPWFDRTGNLLGAQVRRIDADGSTGRYVTFKHDSDAPKIYGWDRVNFHQLVYVVEGPLDSWFLPNAVASMDSDLVRLYDSHFKPYAACYVWDNEPRNRQVTSSLKEAIRLGLSVVIWPESLQEKDLNDMAKAGHDVVALVRNHTYRGLRAELNYLKWKR